MRTPLLCCLFLFFCSTGFGQSCGPYGTCKIVRGDGNCDGSVNFTDYIYINNYLFNGGPSPNLDAADTDDNGQVNQTDALIILYYLWFGGDEPVCPFPNQDYDCTSDGLENCCSPPENAEGSGGIDHLTIGGGSPSFDRYKLIEDNVTDFADPDCDTPTDCPEDEVFFNENEWFAKHFEELNCSAQSDRKNTWDVRWNVDDPIGMAWHRVDEEIQSLVGQIQIDGLITLGGDSCTEAPGVFGHCTDAINIVKLKLANATVWIKLDTFPNPILVPVTWLPQTHTYLWEFKNDGEEEPCQLDTAGSSSWSQTGQIDAEDLYLFLSTCDVSHIQNIEVRGIEVEYDSGSEGEAVVEELTVSVLASASLSYEWCNSCGQ